MVDGPQQVSSQGFHSSDAALSELDEVVNEDVCVSHGSGVDAVGRWTVGLGFVRSRELRVQRVETVGRGLVVGSSSEGFGREVVPARGWLFQAVSCEFPGSGREVLVRDVCYCFGHDAEGRRRLGPSHRARHGDGDELRFPFVLGQDDGQAWAVGRLEEHAVEPIFDIVFGQIDWPELRVGVSDSPQDSMECSAELHGFWRSVR